MYKTSRLKLLSHTRQNIQELTTCLFMIDNAKQKGGHTIHKIINAMMTEDELYIAASSLFVSAHEN